MVEPQQDRSLGMEISPSRSSPTHVGGVPQMVVALAGTTNTNPPRFCVQTNIRVRCTLIHRKSVGWDERTVVGLFSSLSVHETLTSISNQRTMITATDAPNATDEHNDHQCSYSHTEAECPLPHPGAHNCGRACAMCAYVERLESGPVADDRPPQITGGRGLAGFKAEAQDALGRGDVCDRWAAMFTTEDGIVTVQEVEA